MMSTREQEQQVPLASPFQIIQRLGILFGLVLSLSTLLTNTSWGQTVFDNDFNHHEEARTYTRGDLWVDWGPDWSNWENGVSEGRVSLVTGSEARGGFGASLAVQFPSGATGPGESGAQWQLYLDEGIDRPQDPIVVNQMVRLRYRVKFSEGFDFHTGGKLPGLAGGTVPTGFETPSGNAGWSARLMWIDFEDHTNSGSPSSGATGHLLQSAKYLGSGNGGRSEDHLNLTNDAGEPLEIESGKWYTITQLVKMNDVGRENGFIKVWVNGSRVLNERGMTFRTTPYLGISTMYFSTFRGGGGFSELREPEDQTIYFDDFHIQVLSSTTEMLP